MLKTAQQLEEDTLNIYCKAGTVFEYRQVVGLYQNPQSIMVNEYYRTDGYSCAM
jgi:hypothetical protein